MWGDTVLEGVIHRTELRLYLFFSFSDDIEGLYERVDRVISDRTREDFVPITREIILTTVDREWIRIPVEGMYSPVRHREWIVFEVIASIIFLLVHRKICHPAECKLILRYEVEAISTCETDLSEDLTSSLIFSGTEEYHIPDFWIEFRFEGCEFISGEELEDRRFWTISFIDDVRETSRTIRFRDFRERVNL